LTQAPHDPSPAATAGDCAALDAPAGEATHALAGDWTIYRAAEIHASLKAMVADGTDRFDLSDVGEFDSSGVQLLLATRRSLAHAGRRAEFVNAPDTVLDMLRAYALERVLGEQAQEQGE